MSAGGQTVSATLKIINDVAAQIRAQTGCSEMDAIAAALRERPSLYASYCAVLWCVLRVIPICCRVS